MGHPHQRGRQREIRLQGRPNEMGEEMERGQGSTTKPTEKSSYIRTEKNPLDLAMNRLFGGNLQC